MRISYWSSDVCSSDLNQAFYNVCPHRGNQIVTSDFGTVHDGYTCAFHGWSFGINGDLQSISDEETYRPEVIAHRPGLKEVACDIWNGFVFISMNPAPEPLTDFLGVIVDHLKPYPIDRFRRSEEHTSELQSLMRISYAVVCLKKNN